MYNIFEYIVLFYIYLTFVRYLVLNFVCSVLVLVSVRFLLIRRIIILLNIDFSPTVNYLVYYFFSSFASTYITWRQSRFFFFFFISNQVYGWGGSYVCIPFWFYFSQERERDSFCFIIFLIKWIPVEQIWFEFLLRTIVFVFIVCYHLVYVFLLVWYVSET